MKVNKYPWYEGWFYDKSISTYQGKILSQIKDFIELNLTTMDFGREARRLSFSLCKKCKSVFAIDLSEWNIDRTNYALSKNSKVYQEFELKIVNDIIDLNSRTEHYRNH